jgi:hypothetical protein
MQVRICSLAHHQWLMPIVLVSWQGELWRIVVGGQFRQKIHQIQSQQTKSWACLSSHATQEAEIGRIMLSKWPGAKNETPSPK